MDTIDARIQKIEAHVKGTPGTQLVRVLNPDGPGVIWGLGLGGMRQPKEFIYGTTIDAVLTQAEALIDQRNQAGTVAIVDDMAKLQEVLFDFERDALHADA